MREPYGEGVASHTGIESCIVAREGEGEALADDQAASASEAEGHQRDPSAAHARAHPGGGSVAAVGRARVLPVLRGAAELPGDSDLSLRGDSALAPHATAAEPEEPGHVGEDQETGQAMDTHTPHPASVSRRAVDRHDLRQEPSAVTPLAGIRGGGSR